MKLLNNIIDPNDCIMKYLNTDSLLQYFDTKEINPNKFNSIPNHANHQLLDVKVKAVPKPIVIKNIIL